MGFKGCMYIAFMCSLSLKCLRCQVHTAEGKSAQLEAGTLILQ